MYYRLLMAMVFIACIFSVDLARGESACVEDEPLAEITVLAQRISSENPAASYVTVATVLRFRPAIDLQARGMPEGQSDITIRGGLFENTGIKIGAINLFDPQTGHYVADVPVPPEFLSLITVRTGIENAITGFNSSIATLEYAMNIIEPSGHLGLGFGTDNLRYQTLSVAGIFENPDNGQSVMESTWGGAVSLARSEGDGSVSYGDHQFERVTALLQRRDAHAQTDAMLAYQDKFYGWPGAYTGFASFAETDHTQSTLALVNHRQWQSDRNFWEVGAFYRQLEDDYDFNRFAKLSGVPGAFEHKTRSYAVGTQGTRHSHGLDWRYSAQLTADELVSSTDLVEGGFNKRRYVHVSLVPSKRIDLSNGSQLAIQAGLSFDASNHDSSALSPLAGATYEIPLVSGALRYRLEYAVATQLPGYTVLKSRPAGLFGGNADLGRERARTIEFAIEKESTDWLLNVAFFVRYDDDLVDWTFLSGAPFVRQANAVDIEVTGAEFFLTRKWPKADIALGYAYLHKDADYGAAAVDASYYALNFANHRITFTARYRPINGMEIRLDNEFRDQHDNPLRSQTGNTFYAVLSVGWRPAFARQFVLNLTGANLTNSRYEAFPGAPAPGRMISVSGRYDW